jgi:hypothetical protein
MEGTPLYHTRVCNTNNRWHYKSPSYIARFLGLKCTSRSLGQGRSFPTLPCSLLPRDRFDSPYWATKKTVPVINRPAIENEHRSRMVYLARPLAHGARCSRTRATSRRVRRSRIGRRRSLPWLYRFLEEAEDFVGFARSALLQSTFRNVNKPAQHSTAQHSAGRMDTRKQLPLFDILHHGLVKSTGLEFQARKNLSHSQFRCSLPFNAYEFGF